MRRVAITTDSFEAAAAWFTASGLAPVRLPCIRVETAPEQVLGKVRREAATADLVLITSARTVDVLWSEAPMPTLPVAAVGEATARAVEAAGGRVRFIGSGGLADLVAELQTALPLGRVVVPCAAGSDPEPLERIDSDGTEIVPFEVYRTVPIAPDLEPVDAVAFASPSAVEGWRMSRTLDGLVVGAIGHTTAAAVAGHQPLVVPSRPSHRALAESLARFLEIPV